MAEFGIEDFYEYYPGWRTWAVFFKNDREVSTVIVQRIFSKYGEIQSVTQTGSAKGHCFVNFVSEKSARRCVIDLLRSNLIRLNIFNPYHDNNHRSIKRLNGNITPLSLIYRTAAECEHNGGVNCNEQNDDFCKDALASIQQQNRGALLKVLRQHIETIPEVLQKVTTVPVDGQQEEPFYVPAKSQVPWTKLSGVTVKWIPVALVIVANIPDAVSASFIKKLLERYEPIFISKIKPLSLNSVRYCHAYFKTDTDAQAVETYLDNGELCGVNVIVPSAKTLMSTAATS